jgi:hypothetical protein
MECLEHSPGIYNIDSDSPTNLTTGSESSLGGNTNFPKRAALTSSMRSKSVTHAL